MRRVWYALASLFLAGLSAGSLIAETARQEVDLVLGGGRVIDPETGIDAVLNVGIVAGSITSITEDPIPGQETVEVGGLVVAPGFIDLHAHGQDMASNRLQAADGVTTALELEIGVYPVGDWLASREGKALIHYGATVGHLAARVKLFHGIDLGSWALSDPTDPDRVDLIPEAAAYAYKDTSGTEREQLISLMLEGLEEGGLGFGLGITYTPGASREEILTLFEVAKEQEVPIYVHIRGEGSGGTLGAFQECIANAAITGASLHIVHMNSSAGERAKTVLGMIRGAHQRGLDVTTESYPYTAGSTRIESALFDSWEGLKDEDYARLQWPLTGERLNATSFERYRKEGGWVIIHGRSEEINEWIVSQPDVMVASDGIPFLHGPAHPRGAGTFARVLGHYVRERKALSLMEALRKMTLMPAQRLESVAPVMKKKGRIQIGADADLTIFDPRTIIDRSTYEKGDVPSAGIVHVLVGGTFVLKDSEIVEGVFPGRAIRGTRKGVTPADFQTKP